VPADAGVGRPLAETDQLRLACRLTNVFVPGSGSSTKLTFTVPV
jgi:hypothetical protein